MDPFTKEKHIGEVWVKKSYDMLEQWLKISLTASLENIPVVIKPIDSFRKKKHDVMTVEKAQDLVNLTAYISDQTCKRKFAEFLKKAKNFAKNKKQKLKKEQEMDPDLVGL